MVLRLLLDVLANRFPLGSAHRECAVTFLHNILSKELTYAERGGAGASPAGAHTPMLPGRVRETGASEAT
jgi:hypothetical protein